MKLVSWAKKELYRLRIKSFNLVLPRVASIKSLPMPSVHREEISADLQCASCQKKLADVMLNLTDVECVVVDRVTKKVMLVGKSATVRKGSSRMAVTC